MKLIDAEMYRYTTILKDISMTVNAIANKYEIVLPIDSGKNSNYLKREFALC